MPPNRGRVERARLSYDIGGACSPVVQVFRQRGRGVKVEDGDRPSGGGLIPAMAREFCREDVKMVAEMVASCVQHTGAGCPGGELYHGGPVGRATGTCRTGSDEVEDCCRAQNDGGLLDALVRILAFEHENKERCMQVRVSDENVIAVLAKACGRGRPKMG